MNRKAISTESTASSVVRCAIYTRKSTEEGLEQEFNSLDAQRESAEAYIKSQQHEGWICLPDRYDDGGFTGGNMERPALRRLMADIEAGRIDCVVVYKVDRLSRSLRPSELCRLLNSTPLGEVINDRQLYRHRTRAGNRVGDGKHIDLLRYVGWLVQTKHTTRHESDGDSYERMKDRARARNAALALAGRDIGELPQVANHERKARSAMDFQFFCESYFPRTFHLAWSADHIKVMQRIEQAVLRGGLFAMAMPRGSGKTTICECACICRHHRSDPRYEIQKIRWKDSASLFGRTG